MWLAWRTPLGRIEGHLEGALRSEIASVRQADRGGQADRNAGGEDRDPQRVSAFG
jgi:hypothetical protein